MAAPTVTYTFTANTTASAAEVNQNFTDLIDALTDGTADVDVGTLTSGNITSDGTTSLDGAVTINDSGADVDFRIESDTRTAAFFIDGSNGYVGLNDATPENPLTIASGDTGVAIVKAYTTAINGRVSYQIGNDADNWFVGIDTNDNFFIADAVGGSNRLTINQSGNVGIGATPSTARVEIAGDTASQFITRFLNDGNNANRYGLEVQCGADDGSGNTYYFNAQDGNGTTTGYIWSTGGTFALVDTSDERLKTNIVDTPISGLDIINGLRIRDFEYKKNPGAVHTGFIAQEVESVYPRAVAPESEMNPYKGVVKDEFISVLIKSVQELTARLEALEAK